MPKKFSCQKFLTELVPLTPKRAAYFSAPPSPPEKTEEQKTAEKNEEALKKKFGLDTDQAQEEVKKIQEERKKDIQELVGNWSDSSKVREFGNALTSKVNAYSAAGKKALSDKIEEIAKARATKELEDLGVDDDDFKNIDNHTSLSLTILSAKVDTIKDFKKALEDQIKNEQAQVERINQVNGILKIRKKTALDKNQVKAVNARLKRFKQMQSALTDIQAGTEDQKKKREEKMEKYHHQEELVRSMLIRNAPELVDKAQEVIAKIALLKKGEFNPRENVLIDFLDDKKGQLNLTEAEMELVLQAAERLIGNSELSRDFHMNHQYERGKLNRPKDNLKDRLARITKIKPHERKLKFKIEGGGEMDMTVVSISRKKVFFRTRDGKRGVIETTPEKELMTVEGDDGFDSYKISVPDAETTDPGINALEFNAEKMNFSTEEDA